MQWLEQLDQYKNKIKKTYSQHKKFWDSNLIDFEDYYAEFICWCLKHPFVESKSKFTTYFHNQLKWFNSNKTRSLISKNKKNGLLKKNGNWVEQVDYEKVKKYL